MSHLVGANGDFGFHRMGMPSRLPNLPNLDVFGGMDKKDTSLKTKLESNNHKDALNAMKQVVAMLASGQDVAYLMPSVVKQVVSPDVEVKKLAYMYLVRYAEEEPDIALLSINSFQKDLKGPNQFIRASALRVMTSIRVEVVVPLMVLAVKQTVADMSPYVRKVTAHALPKIYNIDEDQKDELSDLIEKLLADRAVLVLGSAIYAFESVCPERLQMIDKHFRKLCETVVDFDEWGQIVCVNLLTRYARTQFLNPNEGGDDVQVVDENKPFYSDSDDSGAGSDSESNRESNSDSEVEQAMPVQMDADHRLLLNSVKPLLLSRNSGVVFAVAQLYYYLAPRLETAFVGQAMVRLVGLQREIAATVLSSIVTMSATRPQMFSPYLKSFFVRDDPVSVSLAKITVMVNLASETNISILLSEFGSYIRSVKTEVALAAIDGVGLCAQRLPSVTPNCIHTLTPFLSAGDETIAGQSIVVIQRLLQQPPPSTTATRPSAHHSSDSDSDSDDDNSRNQQRIDEEQAEYRDSVTRVIRSLAKLLMKGQITVPTARASVTWLVGEHVKQLPKLGPDVLRLQMKSYITLSKAEKLQVLNLASKLYLVRAKRSERYLNYVLLLTNYDADYDLRDKGRFLRGILGMKTKGIEPGRLADVLLCKKPAPAPPGKPTRDEFQLGTLSQVLGKRLHGYQPLPDFPSVAPDPTPRQVTWDRGATETSLSGKSGGFGMFPKSSNGFLNATPRTDSVGDERQRDFYSSSGSDSQTNSDSDYSNSSRRSSYSDSGSDSRSDGGHSTDSRGSARPHRHNRRAASSSSSGSQSEDFYSSSSNTDSDSSLPGRSAKTKKASKKAIPDTRSDYTDSGTDSGSQSDTGLYR